MFEQTRFYEESGKINSLGYIIGFLVLIAIIIPLSYIYTYIVNYMPIIYFTVLATIGFGVILGFSVEAICRFTHNRNFKSRIALAIFAGLFASYCQWTQHVHMAIGDSTITGFSSYLSSLGWLFTNPSSYMDIISEIGKTGTWSIGLSNGLPINGIMLYLIWAFEFIIILILPIVMVWRADKRPYSEMLGKPYARYEIQRDFGTVVGSDRFFGELEGGVLNAINNIGAGDAWRHTRIHLNYLIEERVNYLSFEGISIANRGQGKKERSTIIENYRISEADAQAILESFEVNKAWW